MALELPPCPDSLKEIQHFLNVAQQHDGRDLTVSYWCRLHALQLALKIDKTSDGAKRLLLTLMNWLEQEKKANKNNDTIINETVAQAYIENAALNLFKWADSMDRASTFNKNVVKAFYTSSILMEVLQTFGEVSEDIQQNKRYAKWKAAYLHNCLKNGETPVPGPPDSGEGSEGPSLSSQGPANSSQDFNLLPGQPSQPRDTTDPNVATPTFPTPSFPAPTSGGNSNPGPSINTTPVTPGAYQPSFPVQPPVQPSFPAQPSIQPQPFSPAQPTTQPGVNQPEEEQEITYIEADLIKKCQKYIKFAGSALNYDDYKEAKSNLRLALHILNTGRES